MGIDATTSSTVSSSSQVSSSSGAESSKKTSADSSFKDEMNKVSANDKKETVEDNNVNIENKVSDENNKETVEDNNVNIENKVSDENNKETATSENTDTLLNDSVDYSNYASIAVQDANMILSHNILKMVNTNPVNTINALSDVTKNANIATGLTKTTVNMTESDAQFFLNLTQTEGNDVSMQNVMAQAQTMVDNGASVAEVKQNIQISQTLLDALSKARETNQPLRIDFDQNVSVILRIGKDGSIAANFIPGDKAVEQYLRNNISNLRAVFNENDLPYTELSYSNSSKQQNERRRNQQKQGEQ